MTRGRPMAVVVPYTTVHPEVQEALAGHDAVWYDVSGSDDAYWGLFDQLWRKGESFIVVEHDIVLRPGVLAELEECPHDWCSVQVPYVDLMYAGLSCCKFTASLIARHPDAITETAGLFDDKHPPKHWCMLDSWIQGVLPGRAHVHGPGLTHLRGEGREGPWRVCPSHDCWRDRRG